MTHQFDQGAHAWRKSSYSGAEGGECVEAGVFPDGALAVRDTKKHGTGPVLGFSRGQWAAFVGAVGRTE